MSASRSHAARPQEPASPARHGRIAPLPDRARLQGAPPAHARFEVLVVDPEGSTCRSGSDEPEAHAACRHDPEGLAPASTPSCRSASRTLRKVEAIVREEMNRAGAQEILMLPLCCPPSCGRRAGAGTVRPAAPAAQGPHERDFLPRSDARGDRSPTSCAATSRAIASCRSTSTRSRSSSATRSGRASACCAGASS